MEIDHTVVGKYIVEGTIELLAPLLIGGNRDGLVDLEVLIDSQQKPYIPASGFAGAFREMIQLKAQNKESFFQLFGGVYDKGKTSEKNYQSHFILADCMAIGMPTIEERDGVKINPKTGIAEDGGLYNYQLVASGACFHFHIEVTIRKGFIIEEIQQYLSMLTHQYDQIRLGAFTSFGFGKWEWKNNTFRTYFFNFNDPEKPVALHWFNYRQDGKLPSELETTFIKNPIDDINSFSINASFKIKNSLIIGSKSSRTDVDKGSLKSANNFVLSGKSLKGALRHRARKILSVFTSNNEEVEQFLNKLMGYVIEKSLDETEGAQKSRLIIEESIIEKPDHSQIQPRVKIDRFTGAAVNGALFDSQPLFTSEENNIRIQLRIKDAKESEKGLLLLLIKDLWTSDLPVGGEKNVGRGVLEGISADISFGGYAFQLVQDDQTIKITGKDKDQNMIEDASEKLNTLVKSLSKYFEDVKIQAQ